jgi:acetate kinase
MGSKIDWTGKSEAALLKVETSQGQSLEEEFPVEERQKATGFGMTSLTAQMLNTLWRGNTQVIAQLSEIDVVGHRVVHGGQEYSEQPSSRRK